MNFNDQISPSLNNKAYQGLSLRGLAMHIASSILLWKNGFGTENDCKHAIAHNVRAYQRRLIIEREDCEIWITQNATRADKKQIELEHAIPVGCLMNLLFCKVQKSELLIAAAAQVANLIRENTVLVWVTKDEHAKLNRRYQSKMPDGFDTYPWREKLARYRETPDVSGMTRWNDSAKGSEPVDRDLLVEIQADFSTSPQN